MMMPDLNTLPIITIEGKQLKINGASFHMKGLNWNPVPRGGSHPQDLDYSGFVE